MEELKELEEQQMEGEETTELVEVDDYNEDYDDFEESESNTGKIVLSVLGGMAVGIGAMKAGEYLKKKYEEFKSKKDQQKDVVDATIVGEEDSNPKEKSK